MRLFISTIFITLSFFLMGASASAQIPAGDFIQLTTVPEFPRSAQNVVVSLKSSSVDLQNSAITWTVNGAQKEKGKGVTSIETQTGKPGSATRINAAITTNQGVTVQKSLTIHPADVDIVWEADSYIPPFYEGKPSFSYQSNLKIVAVPNFYTSTGARIDPKTLVYTWKQDSTVLGSQSGYGKDSLTIKGAVVAKPITIGVEVNGSERRGQAELDFEAVAPYIVFYEENPLYGTMYNKAIKDTHPMKSGEITFTAVPYFFSNSGIKNNSVEYTWTINNRERTDLKTAKSITLRTKEDVEGISIVGLRLRNLQDIFQSANKSFNVQFAKEENSEAIEF